VPILAALVVLATGCGSAEIEDEAQLQRLETIRKATIRFADRERALAEGYRPLPRCVESSDGEEAVGLVYLQLERARDRELSLLEPEQLFYAEQPDGSPPVLVGVGYFVPDEGQKLPRSPLGHLDGPIPGQFPGQPAHFELHAWVHRENPKGVLAFFNPRVTCP
jgi:hypothetical protein